MPPSPVPHPGDGDRRGEPAFEVTRTRLLAVIDEGVRGRLSLILGPSGSGKSVLVRQWVRSRPNGTVAALSVDVEASDAESFGRDLVRAVGEVHPGFGEEALRRLGRSGDRLGRPFLEAFLEGIADLGPLTVVVDDLHELPCAVTEELGWLIMRTNADFHLVVATRTEPPMRLPRLRAHGQLTEIRAAALALDEPEAASLAEHVAGRQLTRSQRQLLRERTEGWAAGVQLAALALRDTPDVDEYLQTFSGANRDVADYLIDEVVRRQPAELRSFLWATSVLDHLDPDLCDALTGRDDASEVLTELQRRELFVVPVDSQPGSFRYHQLFAEVMRHQLRAQDRALHDDLLVRAARWRLDRDELAPAVENLLRAERWEEALDLVGANGWTLYERGETALAVRWLEAVPSAELRRHGQAEFTLVTLYRFAGQAVAATALLDKLERDRPAGSRGAMAVDVLRATGVRQDVSPEEALAGAQAAVEWFADEDHPPKVRPGEPSDDWVLSCTRVYGAMALVHLGRLPEAREWLSIALELSTPFRPWRIRALGCLALLEVEEGNLDKALSVVRQAFKIDAEAMGVDPVSTLDAHLAAGMVAYERDELGDADDALGEAESLSRVSSSTNTLAMVVGWQARVALAQGEPKKGLELLARWRREGNPPEPADVYAALAAVEAQLLLATRDAERAKRVLARAAHTTETLSVAAQLAATEGDWVTLALVLDRWPASPARRSRIQKLLWRGVLAASKGDEEGAESFLRSAVRLADLEGHVRVLLDGGPQVVGLLRTTDVLSGATSLVRLGEALARPGWREPGQDVDGLLSRREAAVLVQLGTLLSNQEIAEKLVISQNTLKTHLRRIYRKLEVRSRREAVARAEEIGLLPARSTR